MDQEQMRFSWSCSLVDVNAASRSIHCFAAVDLATGVALKCASVIPMFSFGDPSHIE